MTYSLKFHPDALQEWRRLPKPDREYFKRKLAERLQNPHIPSARLSGARNLYKIKRKRPPVRLAYQVDDNCLVVTALSIGRRDSDIYQKMLRRGGGNGGCNWGGNG